MSGNGHKTARPVVRFGYVITGEPEINAVQMTPSRLQQELIDDYRDTYKKTFGHAPEGLHYLRDGLLVALPPE